MKKLLLIIALTAWITALQRCDGWWIFQERCEQNPSACAGGGYGMAR